MHMCYKFFTPLGYWVLLAKATYEPKLAGGWARRASQKFWDPYLFLQPVKLATSNLVYNLVLGSGVPRNNFYDQNWQLSGLVEQPKKFGTPYLSLQPLNLVISNLVHTWVCEYLTKKQLLRPNLAGVRTRGVTQKFWDPYLFLLPLKPETSTLVHNMGRVYGEMLIKNNF